MPLVCCAQALGANSSAHVTIASFINTMLVRVMACAPLITSCGGPKNYYTVVRHASQVALTLLRQAGAAGFQAAAVLEDAE